MSVEPWKPVINWLQRQYPRPTINQDWLKNCVSALQASDQPPPNTRELIHATETQLLLSHLANSCLPNTGLPPEEVHDQILFEKEGCLVMILSIQEIGASAFSLKTTMEQRKEVLSGVTRIRRMRDPGEEEGDEDEIEGGEERLPAYSRSMLSLEVTDGFTVMKGMEYRRLPGLVLGETMLGAKMILRNVRVLRNTLLLTPACVTLKDHCVEELEVLQGKMFMNGLRRRMGQEELPLEDEEVDPAAPNENVDRDVQVVDVDMDEAPPIPPPAVGRRPGHPGQPLQGQERAPIPTRGRLQNAGEEFLDLEDRTEIDEEETEQPIAGPSRPSVRPPGGGRFTLVPELPGLKGKSKTVNQVDEAEESFDIIDPADDELAQILDATSAAAMAADGVVEVDEADWAVLDEMDMDMGGEAEIVRSEEEKSRYFGGAAVKKGKEKEVVKTKTSSTSTAKGKKKSKTFIHSEDEAVDPPLQTRRSKTKSTKPPSRKGKQPLFDPQHEQSDEDYHETDEDSQKENRPMAIDVDADKDEESGPRTRRRDTGKGKTTKEVGAAGDDKEWREVIELSD